MTFKGEDLYNLRKDIAKQDIHLYIESFYRILTPSSLVKNIKSLSSAKIKNVRADRGTADVTQRTAQTTKTGVNIMFNYEKKKEITGFEQKFASRYLAYLLLSKSVPKCVVPLDLFEANVFFKKYFEGEVNDVFIKCCEFNGTNPDEVLNYFRHKLNWSNLYNNDNFFATSLNKKKENKISTFACILTKLTRK